MTTLMDTVVDLSHRRRICLKFDPSADLPIFVTGLPPEASISTFIIAFAANLEARLAFAQDDPVKLERVFTTPDLMKFNGISYIVYLNRCEADHERCGRYFLAAIDIGYAD